MGIERSRLTEGLRKQILPFGHQVVGTMKLDSILTGPFLLIENGGHRKKETAARRQVLGNLPKQGAGII